MTPSKGANKAEDSSVSGASGRSDAGWLDSFLVTLEKDPAVLAVIGWGEFLDAPEHALPVELTLILDDRKKAPSEPRTFTIGEVVVRAGMVNRNEFRRLLECCEAGSCTQVAYSSSRLLFTRDEDLRELHSTLNVLGTRDRKIQLLRAGVEVLPALYEAKDLLVARNDPEYAFLWLLRCVNDLAFIEVLTQSQSPTRQIIRQALEFNPDFFKLVFSDLVGAPKTLAVVERASVAIEDYLRERINLVFALLLDYLRLATVPVAAAHLEFEFDKTYGVKYVAIACQWLAEHGRVFQVSLPGRLTDGRGIEIEEVAFHFVETSIG